MDKKEWEKRLALYDAIIQKCPDFQRKGKNMVYTSANGYMFSQLNKTGELGIRLPKEKVAEFLSAYDSGPFLSYGAVMKDYVKVPDEMLQDVDKLKNLLEASYLYVCSLPPK
jgi:hypothetical protein